MRGFVEQLRSGARWIRVQGWRRMTIGTVLLATLASPLWAPPLLGELEFFRVRKVEVVGVRYLAAEDVFARLEFDTGMSVWDDLDPVRERIAGHPQVRQVRLARRLPGTIIVRVTENEPVALVSSREGMRPIDEHGRELPFDPSRFEIDLPLVASADSVVASFLAALRERDPSIFERISDVRRAGDDHIILAFPEFEVRASPDLSPGRLSDIIPVEQDLARRGARIVELDLRFRDQVIARLQ